MKMFVLISTYCFTIAVVAIGCNSHRGESSNAYYFNKQEPQTGELIINGQGIRPHLKRQIKFDTEGRAFILQVGNLVYRNGHFYLIERTNPEVQVYGLDGNYVKTVQISPRPKPGCAFADITVCKHGDIFIKDIQSSEILQLDPGGQVMRRISTKASMENRDVQIAHGGLEVVESDTGMMIFSSIFQWMDLSDVLSKTLVVGRFHATGILEKQFAQRNPIMAELQLFSHQPTTFTIYENELYLIEEPLPFVRVFSLQGELKRSFGAKSPRHRKLQAEPAEMSTAETLKFIRRHTLHRRVRVIRSVVGLDEPVVAVYYSNAILDDENLVRPPNEVERNHYLALYTLDGRLLQNDIELPGQLFDVSDQSELVVLLSDKPENRVFGLYTLILGSLGKPSY